MLSRQAHASHELYNDLQGQSFCCNLHNCIHDSLFALPMDGDFLACGIVMYETTKNGISDIEVAEKMFSSLEDQIRDVYGDGAYDGRGLRKRVQEWGGDATYPRRETQNTKARKRDGYETGTHSSPKSRDLGVVMREEGCGKYCPGIIEDLLSRRRSRELKGCLGQI